MDNLKNKTLFVSGASRGIGLAISKKAAKDGANIILAAKTAKPHPKLPGTIYTAAEEIKDRGGQALPVICDIRDEERLHISLEKLKVDADQIQRDMNQFFDKIKGPKK